MTDFLVNLSGRLLQFLMQLALIKMITVYLTKTEAAIVFVILLLVGGASLILISPVGQYLNRRIIDFERKDILSWQLTLFFGYTLFVSPFVMIISYLYFYIQDMNVNVMIHIVSGLYFIAITVNQVTIGGLNILGRSKLFVGYSLFTQFLIIIQLLLNPFELNYLTWMVGLVIANITVGILACHALNDRSYIMFTRQFRLGLLKRKICYQTHEVWKFSGKILFTLVCIWIFQVGFRFELLPMIGAEEFALFTVGYSVAVLIFSGCEQTLNSYCLPIYYEKIYSDIEDKSSSWNGLAKIAFPTYLLALSFTITFSEILVILIFDSTYYAAATYVKIGAVLEFLRVIYSLLSLHAHGLNDTKILVFPSVVGLLIFCSGQIFLKLFSIDSALFYLVILSSAAAIYTLWDAYRSNYNPIEIDSRSMFKVLPVCCLLILVFNYLPVNLSFFNAVLVFLSGVIVCFSFWLFIVWEPVSEVVRTFQAKKNNLRNRKF